MIFVWPFNKDLYRRIVERLAYMLWSQVAFILQYWSGSECDLITDDANVMKSLGGKESAMVILNHKYDIDWAMGYMCADKMNILGNSKVYAKSSLLPVPVIGWTWYFTETIFVARNWKKDSSTIPEHIQKYNQYPKDLPIWILLFPEGTRFTKKKQEASNAIAREKGLPELRHHLLPRTRGFVESMKHLKGVVPAIYDCVVAFTADSARPDVLNVISGKSCKAQIKVRRIPIDEVPTDSSQATADWLHQLMRDKDAEFDYFVEHGEFKGRKVDIPRRPHSAIIYAFWFMILVVPVVWYLINCLVHGSLQIQIGAVLALVIVSMCVKLLISVTQIEKSSGYGDKNKAPPASISTGHQGNSQTGEKPVNRDSSKTD